MAEVIANSPQPGAALALTSLAAAITTTSQTSITVNTAAPTVLQSGSFRGLLYDGIQNSSLGELVLVTSGQSGTGWTITRGASLASPDTCSSYTWNNGTPIYHVWTAAALNLIFGTAQSVNTLSTGTTAYTGAITDANNFVVFTCATSGTFTIPPNSSVAFPVGTILTYGQGGAGTISASAGSGVTIQEPSGPTSPGQYQFVSAIQVSTNIWWLGPNAT
jgi:hypothetical protein